MIGWMVNGSSGCVRRTLLVDGGCGVGVEEKRTGEGADGRYRTPGWTVHHKRLVAQAVRWTMLR